jgi:2,4-dienoyl-CoA reductase-like NADH-dependent reductase (Old Yellow Enzyme family)
MRQEHRKRRIHMPKLFEETTIKSLTLPNRFVRSATWEGLAGDDGSVTPRLIDVAVQLARGGVGLIISGHAYVSREGQAGSWQLGAYSDKLVPGLTEMVKAVHDCGGKIAMQLAHAGSKAASRLSGLDPMGPSTTEIEGKQVGREMTKKDIGQVAQVFADAALRARAAGFDAVQFHAAHGYLLSQFLSPYFNKRTDEYGGSIDNRTHIAVEVLEAIQKAVGPDFPIFIKINSEDFLPEGLTVDDMIKASEILEKAGIDGIEMSGGTFLSGKNSPSRQGKPGPGKPEAYYEVAAKRYKDRMKVPLMLVGGLRTIETAERLVADGVAEYIAMCRPLIREPGLVNRWKSGDRGPALCVSDSGCFKPGFEGKGVSCVVEARSIFESKLV